MSPEAVAIIQSILNSDDLALGMSTEDPRKPYTMSGAGEKVSMTRDVAERILDVMEKDWGTAAPEAIVMRGILTPSAEHRI
jgi:hypothetical protein